MAQPPEQEGNLVFKTASVIAQGEIPSNVELTGALKQTREAIDESAKEVPLSTQGQQLAKDAEQILESAEKWIKEKNKDDKLQKLVEHAKEAIEETKLATAEITEQAAGKLPSKQDLQAEFQETLYAARELAYYFISSSEFRSLLSDLLQFFHDMIVTASDKVSKIAEVAKSDFEKGDTSLSTTKEEVKQLVSEVKSSVEQQTALSEQQIKQLKEQFTKLVTEISKNERFKRAINNWWTLYDQFWGGAEHFKKIVEKLPELKPVEEVKSSFEKVWNDAKDLLIQFIGKEPFENVSNLVSQLIEFLRKDKETNEFFNEFREFFNESIKNPGDLISEQKQKELSLLLERARCIVMSFNYNKLFNDLYKSLRLIVDSLKRDTLTQEFNEKLSQFARDFALDEQGRVSFARIQESLSQIRSLFVPLLTSRLTALPIPKLELSDETYDVCIENLLFNVGEILPQFIDITTKNLLKMDVKHLETDKIKMKIKLYIKNLRPHFKNMRFYYKRKTFPRIEDHGIADVDLTTGEGTSLKVFWVVESKHDMPLTMSLTKVQCIIDKLDIDIKEAEHSVLDKFATTFFIGQIKKSVAQSVVNAIVDIVEPFNIKMNEFIRSKPLDRLTTAATQQVKSAVETTHEKLKQIPVASTAVETIEEKLEQAKEKTKEYIEKPEKLTEALKDVKEGAAKTVQAVKESASKAVQTAEEIYEHPEKGKEKLAEVIDQTKQKGIEIVEKKKQKAEEMISSIPEQAKQKVAETWEKTKEKADQLIQQASQRTTEAMEKAKNALPSDQQPKYEQYMEEMKKKLNEVAEQARQQIEALEKQAKEMNEHPEKLGEVVEQAKEKAAQVAETLKQQLPEQPRQKLEETVQQAKETAGKVAETTKVVYEHPEPTKKKLGEAYEEAKQRAGQVTEELKGKAKEAYEQPKQATEKAKEAWETTKEQTGKTVQEVKQKANEGIQQSKQQEEVSKALPEEEWPKLAK